MILEAFMKKSLSTKLLVPLVLTTLIPGLLFVVLSEWLTERVLVDYFRQRSVHLARYINEEFYFLYFNKWYEAEGEAFDPLGQKHVEELDAMFSLNPHLPTYKQQVGILEIYQNIDVVHRWIGLTYLEIWEEPDRSAVNEALQRVLQGEPMVVEAKTPTRKTRTQKWWHVILSPVYDDHGAATHFVSVSQDITDRKQSERMLRLTQFSMDHVDMGVVWVDSNGRFV